MNKFFTDTMFDLGHEVLRELKKGLETKDGYVSPKKAKKPKKPKK